MKKINTIIVDDEVRIHKGIERMVLACGEDWNIVGVFSDGIEVIEFLQESQIRIDLLITDVRMPEMDGLTLIKEIKSMNRDRSFFSIIVSGYDDFQYLQTAIREGAIDYVLKPIDRTQFNELLLRVKSTIYDQSHRSLKWNDLLKQADRLELTKQTQFLSETVSSGQEDISSMYWIKDFPEGLYRLLYVSTDDFPVKTRGYSSKDWGVMAYAIQNILEEVLITFAHSSESQMGWWWRESGFHFWVLLYSSKEAEDINLAGEVFSKDLKSYIKQFTPFSVSIAVGAHFRDLSILYEQKQQLQSLIRFRMLYGGNKLYSPQLINELAVMEGNSLAVFEIKELINKLIITLGRSTLSHIEEKLRGLFKEMEKLPSPEDIRFAIRYLIIQLYNICMESQESINSLSDLDDIFEVIKAESNFNRIKALAKQIFIDIHNKQQKYQQDNEHDPIARAKLWIRDNLSQKISVKAISNHVYMNPTYFCECFKKQTGQTVLDFITEVRLEKAKELTQNIDLKVGEISLLVGYQDTKYFSRLFKQKWGQLPSEMKRK